MPQLHTQGRALTYSTDDIRLGRLLVNVHVPDMDYTDLVTDKSPLSPSDVQITNIRSGYNQWQEWEHYLRAGRQSSGGGNSGAFSEAKRLSATRRSPLLAPESKQHIVFCTTRVSRYQLIESERFAEKLYDSPEVQELVTNQVLVGKENATASGSGTFTAHLVVGYTTFLNPKSVVLVKDKIVENDDTESSEISSPTSPIDVDPDLWETGLSILKGSAHPQHLSKCYSKVATCSAWGERIAGVKTRRLVVNYTIHVNPPPVRVLASKLRSSSRTLTIDSMLLLDDDASSASWTMLWGQAYNAGHVLAIIGGGMPEEDIQCPINAGDHHIMSKSSTPDGHTPISPTRKSISSGASSIEIRKEIPSGNFVPPSVTSRNSGANSLMTLSGSNTASIISLQSIAREDNESIIKKGGLRKPSFDDHELDDGATVTSSNRTTGASSVPTSSPLMYSLSLGSWNQSGNGSETSSNVGVKRDSLGLFVFTDYQNGTSPTTLPPMKSLRSLQNYPPRILIPIL